MASAKEKRREMAVDLSLVVGLPLFEIILCMSNTYTCIYSHVLTRNFYPDYFVQGHRFNIFEQIGCFPVTFNTPPAYALVWMWPLLLGAISMVYCTLTVWAFMKRRREMNQFLNSNAQITMSRYFRLMALSMMDTFLTVPLACFAIWLNAVESTVSPWKGLADAHWGFSRVEQIAAVQWRLSKWNTLSFYLDRWFIVFCAIVFFAFFGFAEESRKNYAKVYWTVAKRFGYYPPIRGYSISGSSAIRTPNLPQMSTIGGGAASGGLRVLINTDEKLEKRDSFLSSIGDLSSSFTVDESFDDRKNSPADSFSTDSLPQTPNTELASGIPHLHSDAQPQGGLTVPPAVHHTRPNSIDMV